MKIVQKQCSEKIYELKGIAWIYGVLYNPQHQGAVRVFNRTVQFFLPQQKTIKRKKLKESYSDSLIY